MKCLQVLYIFFVNWYMGCVPSKVVKKPALKIEDPDIKLKGTPIGVRTTGISQTFDGQGRQSQSTNEHPKRRKTITEQKKTVSLVVEEKQSGSSSVKQINPYKLVPPQSDFFIEVEEPKEEINAVGNKVYLFENQSRIKVSLPVFEIRNSEASFRQRQENIEFSKNSQKITVRKSPEIIKVVSPPEKKNQIEENYHSEQVLKIEPVNVPRIRKFFSCEEPGSLKDIESVSQVIQE